MTFETFPPTIVNDQVNRDLFFNQHLAIALVCDNGATLPDSPVVGQWFCHTPTGRTILYQHDGTDWLPIISIGAMTLYVDKTDGSDTLSTNGTGVDGDAFATIQFAIDMIPGLVGGNVVINVNGEAFGEAVIIQGKYFTSNYTITINGTLSEEASATLDSAVAGTGATQGSITDTGAFGSYDNKLLYSTSEDLYRIIDSDTANTATIVGTWEGTAPTGNYKVYDWATSTDSIQVEATQQGIIINDFKITTHVGHWEYSSSQFVRCWFSANPAQSWHKCDFVVQICYAEGRLDANFQSTGSIQRTKIDATSGIGMLVQQLSHVNFQYGIIDMGSGATTDGVRANANCNLQFANTASRGYSRIRNCDEGIKCQRGSMVFNTGNIQYSGNTTDENPSGASDPAYID